MTPTAAVVLLAAGSGTRTGLATNKVFARLAGRRVLSWSLAAVCDDPLFGPVVVVVRADELAAAGQVLAAELPGRDVQLVSGGATRHRSEWNALQALADDVHAGSVDVVVVHDAARPLAPATLFAETVAVAREHGGAVPGRLRPALLRRPSLHPYGGTGVAVQTPQAFRAVPLLAAHAAAAVARFEGSDTAACVERFAPDLSVRHVEGPATNLKITFADDLELAEALLARGSAPA